MIGKYLYQFVYVFYYKHDLWHKGSVFLAIRTLLHCKYSAYIRFMSVFGTVKVFGNGWLSGALRKTCLFYNVKVIMIRGFKLRI